MAKHSNLYKKFSIWIYKIFYEEIDSTAFLGARLIDINFDLKANIITPIVRVGLNYAVLVDYEQQGTIGIENIYSMIPKSFTLYQNHPNPFNSETTIGFDIRNRDLYKIELFDVTGKKVGIILNKILNPGVYKINFNSVNLSSGIYFYKLSSSISSQSKKFVLIK